MPNYPIFWTGIFLSVGLLTSSFEMLYSKNIYCGYGLMNWEISKMRSPFLMKSNVLNFIFSEVRYHNFVWFRFFAGLALIFSISLNLESVIPFAFLLVFFSYLLFTLRTPYGLDGSDQAALLVALIYSILCFSDSHIIILACHLFLAAQLSLVYLTSGWNKLKAKDWRNGEYLWKLFSTGFYGMEKLGGYLEEHKLFSRLSSLSVVLAETFFIIYWIIPAPYCWFVLAALAIFHFITAITMGLNTFFWAFLAMYPSTIYCRLLY